MNYLLNAPLQIGQKVYFCVEDDNTLGNDLGFLATVQEGRVISMFFYKNNEFSFKIDNYSHSEGHNSISFDELNSTVFIDKTIAVNSLHFTEEV